MTPKTRAAWVGCGEHNQPKWLGGFTARTADGEALLPGGSFRGIFHSVLRAACTRLDLGNFQIGGPGWQSYSQFPY